MLTEQTLFGTVDKVAMAIDRIQAYEPEDGYYVAFSGGKDSIVVLDLVRRAGVKHDAHMNMTSIDPPELVRYVKRYYPDVTRHKPVTTMWKLIEKKMTPPTRLVRYCCEILKEQGGKGRFVITGVRAAESVNRSKRRMVEVRRGDNTTRFLHPVFDWTDADVWQYIHDNHLPYCSLYDEGWARIGCIGCPMAGNRRFDEFKRYPYIEHLYRKAMNAAVEKRKVVGFKKEGVHLRFENGDQMFEWWMQRSLKHKDETQCVMFE